MKFDEKKFSQIIKELMKFKTGTTKVHIKAENWEELITAALIFIYGEDKLKWDPQSHEKSVDITLKLNGDLLKISAKAGEIKNNSIIISSYRLTTFNTLEQKLQFIKEQHKTFDLYLICGREVSSQNITYYVIKTSASKLSPDWLTEIKNWLKTKSGYQLKSGLKFTTNIHHKMSDQLWYSIPVNYFSDEEIIAQITIPIEDLGKGLIQFLRDKFGNK